MDGHNNLGPGAFDTISRNHHPYSGMSAVDRRQKVAILLPSHWSSTLGGAEYQAKLLSEHLVASGTFDVHWLSRRVASDFRDPGGCTIHKIARHRGIRQKAFFFDHALLHKLLHQLRPDVIYQRVGSAYTGIAAQYARRYGCRLIWHVAQDAELIPPRLSGWTPSAWLRYIDRLYLRYGVRHAGQIVVQTHDQARLLGENYGRQATKVIRNFHPAPSESIDKNGRPTVVWIGNLKHVKQPAVFIRLAQACADMADVRFVMVGKPYPEQREQGPFEAAVRASPNLQYLGLQSIEAVNALLSRSHVFVNTSLVEGFPNTFIQAWMREVAVLSLNVDPDGLLTRGGIGSCANGDEGVLARTLRRWMRDTASREEVTQRAREYVTEHHAEQNVDSLIQLISQRRGSY
jgi:glycosyltransferase involved in cell wall biosynthesis